jgi:hypothetical protein
MFLDMRCLYCGKELALFKKLTGGGEFCTEEHRQRYHDEYNRLALSRLLQAPVADAERSESGGTLRLRENAPAPLTAGGRRLLETEPEPAEEPALAEVASDAAPAPPAGFLRGPEIAGHIGGVRPRGAEVQAESRVEVRDLARPELRIEMKRSLEELAEKAGDAILPRPPRPAESLTFEAAAASGLATAVIWNYPATDFRPSFELRETLRLELKTSGLGLEPEDTQEPAPTGVSVSISALGHSIALARESWTGEFAGVQQKAPGVEQECEDGAAPDESDPGVDLSEIEIPSLWDAPLSGRDTPDAALAPAAPLPPPRPAPRHALEALPVPVVAADPGRPKAHQVFTASGLAEEIAYPRLDRLPLRPVVLLGPKPEPGTPEQTAPEAAGAAGPAAPVPEPEEAGRQETAPAPGETAPAATSGKLSRRERARLARRARTDAERGPEAPAANGEPQPAEPAAPAASLPPAPPKESATAAEKPPEGPRPVPQPASAPAGRIEAPSFGMAASGRETAGEGLPIGVKIAAAAAGIAVLAGLVYFTATGDGGGAAAGPVVKEAPMLAMTEGSWATDWGASEAGGRPRRIALYRPTQTLSDYRVSFRGEIPGRSLGWVIRAADPRNYWASRLEILKRGLNPTVVLIRYAVIDGEETAPTQIPLPMPVRIDTVYRIQVQALGDQFETRVLDQVVDRWKDSRLRAGGVGLMYDRGDPAPATRSLEVTPLIVQGKR